MGSWWGTIALTRRGTHKQANKSVITKYETHHSEENKSQEDLVLFLPFYFFVQVMYLKQTALFKSKASFCRRPNKTIVFFSSYLKLYSQKAPPPFATSCLLSCTLPNSVKSQPLPQPIRTLDKNSHARADVLCWRHVANHQFTGLASCLRRYVYLYPLVNRHQSKNIKYITIEEYKERFLYDKGPPTADFTAFLIRLLPHNTILSLKGISLRNFTKSTTARAKRSAHCIE